MPIVPHKTTVGRKPRAPTSPNKALLIKCCFCHTWFYIQVRRVLYCGDLAEAKKYNEFSTMRTTGLCVEKGGARTCRPISYIVTSERYQVE